MVTGPAESMTDASATAGWRAEGVPPEPLPPEVLDLFPGLPVRLVEAFVLVAPALPVAGSVTIAAPAAADGLVLVVLRPGAVPETVARKDVVREAGGGRLGAFGVFRVSVGTHDGGTRLLLLAVRPRVLAEAGPPKGASADMAAPPAAAPPPPARPPTAAPRLPRAAPAPPAHAPAAPPAAAPRTAPRAAPAPPTRSAAPPPHVPAWVSADMPSALRPRARAAITVRISRTELGPLPGSVHAARPLLAAIAGQPLRLKLHRHNLEVVPGTPDRFDDVPFPEDSEVVERRFEVIAGDVGPAEATVVVKQGTSVYSLAEVSLVVDVTEDPPPDPEPAREDAWTSGPDPRMAGAPVLRVDEDVFGDVWRFEFDLELGDNLPRHYESAPAVPKAAFLDALFARIDASWKDPAGPDGFGTRLAQLGSDLAAQLLPEDLRADLNAAWDRIGGLALLSTEASVPWELAQLGDPAAPRYLGETGLGRWAYRVVHPHRLRARAGRRRYLCPSYTGELALSQTAREAEFLAGLGATAIEPGDSASLSSLLRGGGFDLLHFGGHGTSDAEGQRLLLAAVAGAAGAEAAVAGAAYPAASLAADYPQRRPDPDAEPGPVVVLNACGLAQGARTGADAFAAAFLAGGAGAFVGCLWSVGDRPALAFAETFYSALRDGRTVSEAVRAARAKARAEGDASWLAYTAYAHPLATVDFSP